MRKRWLIPAAAALTSLLLASCLANMPESKNTAVSSHHNAGQTAQATDTTQKTGYETTHKKSATANALIGRQEAIRIALEHAQVPSEEAKFVKAELDRDRGQDLYEVEFSHNGYEYDYEIHAHTGQILLAEKERD